MKSLVCILLGLFVTQTGNTQSIVAQLANDQGYYALFGSSLRQPHLLLGGDKIQTGRIVITGIGQPPPPPPTLQINPFGGKVTIGEIQHAKGLLTLGNALDNVLTRDIQFEGFGNLGSQGSISIQIDDDDNEFASFRIKGSNASQDLFFVGENGSSFFATDLTVFGDIAANNIRTSDVYTIGFLDVEALDEYGDEVYASIDGHVIGDNDDVFNTPQLGAAINLPDGVTVTKVEVLFKDNNNEESFGAQIFSLNNLGNSHTEHYVRTTSASFQSSQWQKWSNSVNFTIDNKNKLYFVALESTDWGDGVFFRQIKIHFRYP